MAENEDITLEEISLITRRGQSISIMVISTIVYAVVILSLSFSFEGRELVGGITTALLFSPIYAFMCYIARTTYTTTHKTSLSERGKEKQIIKEREELEKSEARSKEFDEFIERWYIRYPIGFLFLFITYTGMNEFSNHNNNMWIIGVCGLIVSGFFMREVVYWGFVAGLICGALYGLKIALFAMPTSVAILLGAIIIAMAIKR